jgi:hypothetical protein
MTPRVTRPLALVVPLLLALAAVGVAPTYAGDPIQSQRVVVKWKGTQKKPKYEKRANVPGIGNLALVCRPKSTIVRLYPYDTSAETQMWLAKYQDTDGDEKADAVAVKNVRVYRYATAADDGAGGTGPSAHEGLNRLPGIENRSQGGYAYGMISQRPGRNQPAGGVATRPVTTFYLTWYWNGFDYAQPWRSCRIAIQTKTFRSSALALNWHGDDDAVGHTSASTMVSGTTFDATCGTGRGNDRILSIGPSDSSVYVEEISGEGAIADHVEAYTQPADATEHRIAGILIPRNGMLRYRYEGQWYLLSSYMVTNNDDKPWLNVCEIAAAPLT